MSREKSKLFPIHPGEILLEEFLEPMELSQYRIAKDINVSARRINEIVLGKRSITADTAFRLAEYFKMSPDFWMNLQVRYDMDLAKIELAEEIKKEVKPCVFLSSFNGKQLGAFGV